MEQWLTHTVPGIVILGAAGSILALGILWAFRLVPLPLRWHRRRTTKQAYVLGYSAATIEDDETGRYLIAFLCYHICMLLIYLTAFSFCGIVFLIILTSQPEIALTWGAFLSCAAAFTLAYVAYFELEFVYRTYLFYWKAPLESASEQYAQREATGQVGKGSQHEEREVNDGADAPISPHEKD
jgi:hypothetical protein